MALLTNVSASVFDILKLHSAFRNGKFLVWGEVDPRKSSPRRLPFCAGPVRITRAISQVVDQAKLPADLQAPPFGLPPSKEHPLAPQGRGTENPAPQTARPQIKPGTAPP